jgi:hypothetical protein
VRNLDCGRDLTDEVRQSRVVVVLLTIVCIYCILVLVYGVRCEPQRLHVAVLQRGWSNQELISGRGKSVEVMICVATA